MSEEKSTTSSGPRKICLWAFAPAVSAAGFLILFFFFGNQVELNTFNWPPVYTNAVVALSNAPPAAPASAPMLTPVTTVATGQPEGGRTTTYTGGNSKTNEVAAKTKQRDPDPLSVELRLRMLWAVSLMIFSALCCVVVVYAIQILFEVRPDGCFIRGLIFGVIMVFVALLTMPESMKFALSGGTAAEQLFQIMGNDPKAKLLNELLRDKKLAELKQARSLVTLAWGVSAVGLASVVMAACGVLRAMRREQNTFAVLPAPPENDTPAREKFIRAVEQAKVLYERRVEITVSLLQLTACALVVGVLEVYLLYNMASYFVQPPLQSDVKFFAQTIATVCGLVYSGFLTAIYLPLVAGQRAIGRELIESHGGNKVTGADTKYVAQLDSPNPKKAPMIEAILTVFSPLLVAFLTKLVSTLMDHF